VAINEETQKAILTNPSLATSTPAQIFNLLDQTSTAVPGLAVPGTTASAFNPFTNVAVTVNRINSNGSVIDPATPALLGGDGIITGLNQPVDVAVDPATNTAVIANQGDNTVSIVSLGGLRTPQILQVSRQDNGAGAPLPPEITVNSTLTTAATANPQTLTIIGSGFINGTSVARLDGTNLATTFVSGRTLTAVVPAAMLTAGPRLYALDVVNGASASNAATFTVAQSVDVTSVGCSAPAPLGVAIDYSSRNLAVVTNPGCNNVAIIQLSGPNAGTGSTVAVGTTPQGVAVHIQSALAVVANSASNNASIVDLNGNTVVATVATDPTPVGVAIDPGLALAVVTASNANVIDTFTVSSTPGTPTTLPVQQRPVAVAVDPASHLAAVANTSSNTVSLVDLQQVTATEHIAASGLPAGIAFDPVTTTFLTASSLLNQVLVLNPVSRSTTGLRVGINPTSIAYNFNSGTLVTTNSSSQTLSVMDFLSGRVRAVLSFRPSGRFAVDIHPFTNLAVIADSAGNRVVLRPLPR
jgi:DNA-binding beta-propeller fold protein YncE